MSRQAPDALLVGMPWESASRPSLAIGTLCALAEEAGFRCAARHLNLDLAARIGSRMYGAFSENLDLFPLAEHFFAVDLFGPERLESEAYLARFGGDPGNQDAQPDPLYTLRDQDIPAFLADATEIVLREQAPVVGFSCTFNQILPSLALARRLKAARPDVTILLGGACVHGPMGVAYAEAFGEFVDYVFTGEADDSFVAWLRAHAAGRPDDPIPGVAGGRVLLPGRLTQNLDRLPVPDYTGFFAQHAELKEHGLPYVHHLPYESSRGCWWGEKHHCTFCGLNNEGMRFRRKSPERIVAELEGLARRFGITSFMAADNILDFRAYRDLLGRLAASPVDFELFYEIKANVRRADVAALRGAGVWRVQPGVESFSDNVLRLMRKGTNGLRNVQLIKWLHEYGVRVDYNILIGFPGETLEDYRDVIRIVRRLQHLPAPNGAATVVRVDRFSPFFDEAGALGIRGLRPAAQYRHLIPEDVVEADRYAYFFDRDESDLEPFQDAIEELNALLAAWKTSDAQMVARLGAGFVEVLARSGGRTSRRVLRGLEASVFVLCDGQTTIGDLQRTLGPDRGGGEIDEAVTALLADGVLLEAGGRIVSVVPFAEARTDAQLQRWAELNDLPGYARGPLAGVAAAPAGEHA